MLLHNEIKEDFVFNPVDSLECLLLLPRPIEKVNKNYSNKKPPKNYSNKNRQVN